MWRVLPFTYLCSIFAEISAALKLSTTVPIIASARMSASSASRFSAVSVFESANALYGVQINSNAGTGCIALRCLGSLHRLNANSRQVTSATRSADSRGPCRHPGAHRLARASSKAAGQ